MLQALKLVAVLLGLFAIAPLATWASTGSMRHAWVAAKEYAFILGLLIVAPMVVGVIVAFAGLPFIG